MTKTEINKTLLLRTYGRRGGRPLSARQQKLLETLLPRLRVPIGAAGALDPAGLFTSAKEIWLEIGFGGGEHVTGQAKANPDTGILASEVFVEGMAKCLGQIEDARSEERRVGKEC